MKKCFYEILNVKKTATFLEIKKSYRKLVVKYHPDRNKDTDYFNNKIKEINEAYECLSDSQKRASYDALNTSFPKFTAPPPPPTSDTVFSIDITLEEVYFGCKKQILITSYKQAPIMCPVIIPKGVYHGQILTVPGNSQVPGFFIKIKVIPHPIFTREGRDLFCEVTIPYIHTITGGTVNFPWFDGVRKLHITPNHPPVITLPNMGLPDLETNFYGNLYISIKVRGLVDLSGILHEQGDVNLV
jgi:DnaJ-class molecular chaperone